MTQDEHDGVEGGSLQSRGGFGGRWLGDRGRLVELGLLAAILLLAAWLRLPNLGERGPWDSDQGRDMAALQSIAEGRDFPLLGPSTSIGGVHHGVVYDYL
ncbi:MAG TPA: hypothetical protein VIH37_05065, partial [Candidatus Limnocylindrales bacterium]